MIILWALLLIILSPVILLFGFFVVCLLLPVFTWLVLIPFFIYEAVRNTWRSK